MKSYRMFLNGWEWISPEKREQFVRTVTKFFQTFTISDTLSYSNGVSETAKLLEIDAPSLDDIKTELTFLGSTYIMLSGEPSVTITSHDIELISVENARIISPPSECGHSVSVLM